MEQCPHQIREVEKNGRRRRRGGSEKGT